MQSNSTWLCGACARHDTTSETVFVPSSRGSKVPIKGKSKAKRKARGKGKGKGKRTKHACTMAPHTKRLKWKAAIEESNVAYNGDSGSESDNNSRNNSNGTSGTTSSHVGIASG